MYDQNLQIEHDVDMENTEEAEILDNILMPNEYRNDLESVIEPPVPDVKQEEIETNSDSKKSTNIESEEESTIDESMRPGLCPRRPHTKTPCKFQDPRSVKRNS